MKECIVHIIHDDKFTNAYIEFMQNVFPEYQHSFLVKSRGYADKSDGVEFVDNWFDANTKRLIDKANKIIFSGFFAPPQSALLFSKKILKKTYIQFWGADFYSFRNSTKLFETKSLIKWCKNLVNIFLKRRIIRLCNAHIFLVEGEEKELSKILNVEKKFLFAPVPMTLSEYEVLKNIHCEREGDSILVGNSASKTNNHAEILERLYNIRAEARIVCPLSYGGPEEYVQKIKEKGYQLFGDKFYPIDTYMELGEYKKLLSECKVAIFDCDRQQALGNIYYLLAMKKKVYLRKGTSMWNNFVQLGVKVHDTGDLLRESYEQFAYQRKQEAENNRELIIKSFSVDEAKSCWNKVFCDGISV